MMYIALCKKNRLMVVDSILDLIGDTPLVHLSSFSPSETVRIYAKLEGNNPGGSAKDRAALGMIKGALDRDEIRAGSHIVEATSGNTGIALALIAKQFGLQLTLVMPDNASKERIGMMRAYGAEVRLTPAQETIEHARDVAHALVKENGYVMLNQFDNVDNWKSHYRTTGPEIWHDTNRKVTHFVSAMGTTGTIMGVSRYLKGKNDDVQVIGVQPVEHEQISGIRRWSREFVPSIFDEHRVDQIIDVSKRESVDMMRLLAQKESIFTGISGGGALIAAQKIAAQLEHGTIVFICPDRGERYLSLLDDGQEL